MSELFIWQEKQAQQHVAAAEQQHAVHAEEEEAMSVFEMRRRANIRRNQERMASMGLTPPPLPGHLLIHLHSAPLSAVFVTFEEQIRHLRL